MGSLPTTNVDAIQLRLVVVLWTAIVLYVQNRSRWARGQRLANGRHFTHCLLNLMLFLTICAKPLATRNDHSILEQREQMCSSGNLQLFWAHSALTSLVSRIVDMLQRLCVRCILATRRRTFRLFPAHFRNARSCF